MTRYQSIDTIKAKLDQLSDEQLEAIAAMAEAFSAPTVFSTLPAQERARIDAALDRLDRGEGLSFEQVRAQLDAKLKAVGA